MINLDKNEHIVLATELLYLEFDTWTFSYFQFWESVHSLRGH